MKTFKQFIASYHQAPALIKQWDLPKTSMFFDEDTFIYQHDGYFWVEVANIAEKFETVMEAAAYLYLEWYIPECACPTEEDYRERYIKYLNENDVDMTEYGYDIGVLWENIDTAILAEAFISHHILWLDSVGLSYHLDDNPAQIKWSRKPTNEEFERIVDGQDMIHAVVDPWAIFDKNEQLWKKYCNG